MENSINNDKYILELKDVSVSYNPEKKAVRDVNVAIREHTVTAIMGPSGCGKSTLLRAINRMHELYPDIKTTGEILLKGENIFDMNAMRVRRLAGMVFQRPNPFPTMSIYDAWRSGHITQEAYQKWIKDGYPKTLRIEI